MSVVESPVRVKGRGSVFRRWEQEIVSFFRKMHRKTGIDATCVLGFGVFRRGVAPESVC